MVTLENTLRIANAKLDAIAVAKPANVNVSSEAEDNATPRQIGIRERYTGKEYVSPRNTAAASAPTAGSADLTIWVKLIATSEKEMHEVTCPSV
mmetsp:Transcript_3125/g.5382  ORF Transcript_3125/g.5382 Transcript_3125/m.5382 type:complete len:94 (-) Transcript_3125:505-786(-)